VCGVWSEVQVIPSGSFWQSCGGLADQNVWKGLHLLPTLALAKLAYPLAAFPQADHKAWACPVKAPRNQTRHPPCSEHPPTPAPEFLSPSGSICWTSVLFSVPQTVSPTSQRLSFTREGVRILHILIWPWTNNVLVLCGHWAGKELAPHSYWWFFV
jgi:hypothetical protein